MVYFYIQSCYYLINYLHPKLKSRSPTALRVGMDMADPLASLQENQHAQVLL